MNRKTLIDRLSESVDLSKKICGEFVTAFNIILEQEILTKGEVSVARIGKLYIKTLPRRKGRNPMTGESIMVGPTNIVRFKPTGRIKRYAILSGRNLIVLKKEQ